MKPRLFLFDSSKNFYGEIILDLAALASREFHVSDTQYFIDIGFRAPSPVLVENALAGCPAGIYSSGAFSCANPGHDWKFSKKIKNEPQNKVLHAVIEAPFKNFHLDQSKFSKLKVIIESNRINQTIDGVQLRDIGDVNLESVEFSVRTKNILNKQNINFLSDLLQWRQAIYLI